MEASDGLLGRLHAGCPSLLTRPTSGQARQCGVQRPQLLAVQK